jgi:hypothetical protein
MPGRCTCLWYSEALGSVTALLFLQDFLSVKHKFKLEHQVFCMNLAWNVTQLGSVWGNTEGNFRRFELTCLNTVQYTFVLICSSWCPINHLASYGVISFHAQVTCDSPYCLLLSNLAVHSLATSKLGLACGVLLLLCYVCYACYTMSLFCCKP